MLQPIDARDEALLLHDVEVRQRNGTRGGMRGVGVAVPPHHRHGPGRPEGLGDAPRHDHRAQRDVARGDALGGEHDVGVEGPALTCEHRARTPIAADHLVGDEEHVMSATGLAHPGEVVARRCVDASRADDRLAEEGCNVVPLAQQGLEGIRVVPRHLHHRGIEVAMPRPIGLDARQARPGQVHAVIRVLARDDHGALGLTELRPVAADQFHCRVDGVASPAREEDACIVQGSHRCEALRQVERRPRRQVAERGIGGESAHLSGRRIRERFPPVAHIAVPQPGRRIEIATPLLIDDVRALAPVDDHLAHGRDSGHIGEGMPQARARLPSGSRVLHGRRLA